MVVYVMAESDGFGSGPGEETGSSTGSLETSVDSAIKKEPEKVCPRKTDGCPLREKILSRLASADYHRTIPMDEVDAEYCRGDYERCLCLDCNDGTFELMGDEFNCPLSMFCYRKPQQGGE